MKTCKKKNHTYPKEKKQCPECSLAKVKAWRAANPDKDKANSKAYHEANKDRINARSKAWAKANPDKIKATGKTWAKANPEKIRAKNKACYKAYREANPEKVKAARKVWKKANPGKVNANVAKRRAAKLQRSLNYQKHRFFFEGYYKLAKMVSNTLNEPIHVDHIIPLQGKDVSGLHVPANVQLLDELDNLVKNTSFDFTYENKSWKSK